MDQEDEGTLLEADEPEDIIDCEINSRDAADYPGATKDGKLGQAFQHHAYYEFQIIAVAPPQVRISHPCHRDDQDGDDGDVEERI